MIPTIKNVFIVSILILFLCGSGCKSSGGNSDASLANLTVLDCTLSPAFSPDILLYDAIFPSFPKSVRVIATTNDTNATMTINGNPAASGVEVQVHMSAPPNNLVRIVVVAANGKTIRTYVVKVIVS